MATRIMSQVRSLKANQERIWLRSSGQCDSLNRFAPYHLREKILLLRDRKLMPNAIKISNSKYHCSPIDAAVTHKDTTSHF